MLRSNAIGVLVLEKMFERVFSIDGRGGHFMSIFRLLYLKGTPNKIEVKLSKPKGICENVCDSPKWVSLDVFLVVLFTCIGCVRV